jgi:hypothetical protein
VTAAADNYVIRVTEGTLDLTGTISIDKSLTILGANTGIDGNNTRGAESVLQGSSATLFQLTSTAINFKVDGFKLVGDTVLLGGGIGQEVTFSNNVLDITATKDNVFHLGQTGGYEFNFTGNKVDVTGYTEFFQLFQGGVINVSDNSFKGRAGTYQAGDDNNVPLIVNANKASGIISNNLFDTIDIGVLVAGEAGPLEISGNSFDNLHRVDGATGGGKAAGHCLLRARLCRCDQHP